MRVVVQNNPENISLKNVVYEDVQSILFPLNLMQYFMLCPKYRIHNHLITPNNLISHLLSFIGVVLFLIIFAFHAHALYFDADTLGFPKFADFWGFFSDFIFFSVGFIMNFVLGIVNSKNNISFVLTFQEVHRFLNNEITSKRFIICNWIIVILFPLLYIFVYTYVFIKLGLPVPLLYCMYLLIFMNYNVIYATRVLKLFSIIKSILSIYLWNEMYVDFLVQVGSMTLIFFLSGANYRKCPSSNTLTVLTIFIFRQKILPWGTPIKIKYFTSTIINHVEFYLYRNQAKINVVQTADCIVAKHSPPHK